MRHLMKVRDRRWFHLLTRIEGDPGLQNDLADPTLLARQFGQHSFGHIQMTLHLGSMTEGHAQPRQHVSTGHRCHEGLQWIQSRRIPIGSWCQRIGDPQGKLASKMPGVLAGILPRRA